MAENTQIDMKLPDTGFTEGRNDGFLPGEMLGGYRADISGSVLPYTERVPSGNWEQYLPPGEKQSSDAGDSMSCVTFSNSNSVETQANRMLYDGILADDLIQKSIEMKWLIRINPFDHTDITLQEVKSNPRIFTFDWSDRWIAKMSNTLPEGNYFWKVADTVRKIGMVAESSYRPPVMGTNIKYTWEEYHAQIQEPLMSKLLAEGKVWLEWWELAYESCAIDRSVMIYHMKHAPLQVAIPGHAVEGYNVIPLVVYYFDSYAPFKKQVPNIVQAMKLLLTPRTEALDPDTLLVDIKYGDRGPQVIKLKRALKRLGWTTTGIEAQDGWDMYNDKIANLVMNYKLANVCDGYWSRAWERFFYKGKTVDATTRLVINDSLKTRK